MKNFFMRTGAMLLVLASLPCLANTSMASPLISPNLYVGIEGGYDNTVDKFSADGYSGSIDFALSGFSYGAFLGYQSPSWDKFNIGIELFYDFNNATFNDSLNDGTDPNEPATSIKKMKDYGISLLPGFLITDNSKLYARLGYVNGTFKFNGLDVTKKEGGYQLGLGYLFNFADNFGVRVEYDYTKFNTIHTSPTGDLAGTTSKFSSNEIKMGLEWLLAL